MPERRRPIPHDFLGGSAAEYAAPFVRALEESLAPDVHSRVGAWRLLRELGRGGMGTVYLAERADEQYTARVALKVVRGSLTLGNRLVERFRDERQFLATLDHPGIARLVDGGVTEDGLPWYAMEFVDGVPINRHVEASTPNLRELLTLFLAICEAVQYAHRKLVVHRDLKPSNLLVTADGRPKLVDFGVARLLNAPVGATLAPMEATPAYASPEQLRGEPSSVTDDVYSLGVILTELLSADARANGDLHAIVTTATAVDPTARYSSVEALAADIARHLRREPIAVRSDDTVYRVRRFVSRHRKGVFATSIVVATLVGGLTFSIAQAKRADRERIAAAAAAVRAEQISAFLTRLLYLADPGTTIGSTVTVADAIDSAAAWLDRDLAVAPEAHAAILVELANLYGATGNIAQHRALADSALAMQERLWGVDDPRLAPTMGAMVEARWSSAEMAESEPLLRRMIALSARDTVDGVFSGVHARNLLAISLRDQGRLEEAEAVLRDILEDRAQLEEIYPIGIDHALNGLGHIQLAAKRPALAAASYREVLGRRRARWGATHPDVANALVNLAQALGQSGAYAVADSLYAEGLAMRRVTQGEEHPEIGVDLVGRGDIALLSGDTLAAVRSYREAVRRLMGTHGPNSAIVRDAQTKLAALR